MKASISISDFRFTRDGYGAYKVVYESPITGHMWTCRTTNMPLIDDTKNSDNPKIKDLVQLKRLCKQ